MNPILQALNGSRIGQAAAPIKNLLNSVRAAGNPQAMIDQLATQNPLLKQAQNYITQNGGDARAAFYNLAQQIGVNPNDIINMLR